MYACDRPGYFGKVFTPSDKVDGPEIVLEIDSRGEYGFVGNKLQ